MTYNNKRSNNNRGRSNNNNKYNNRNRRDYRNKDNNNQKEDSIIIRNRNDKGRLIKEAIFAFSGGKKTLLIKGEGNEISTAVEVAEIIKNRMYPSVEVANISLGSRPFFYKKTNTKENTDKKKKSDIVSNIEILLKTT